MSRLPPLTDRQREAAVERAGESIALTSGAGCGKTLVLARRFTTLLLETGRGEGGAEAGDAAPSVFDRFVALTFTDKAALEMVARVRRVLRERLALSGDEAERARLADWITELPAANIATIHSFCAGLLRRYAVEAGVDPGFAVAADDLLTDQMRSEAAEEAVLVAAEAGDPAMMDLLARTGPGRVIELVELLLGRRSCWADTDYADPAATLARWRKGLERLRTDRLAGLGGEAALRADLAALWEVACSNEEDKLAVFLRERLPALERVLEDPQSAAAEDLELLAGRAGGKGSAKAWEGKDRLMAVRGRLRAIADRFIELRPWCRPPGEADEAAAAYLALLTRLAGDADRSYDAAKRRLGILDFDDLIDRTARLLRDRPAVRDALRRRLDQLLVDECQDTDATQLRMLWSLLSDDRTPPPGKLFIVGDVKQSIYRFRGAQAEVFDELCGRFGTARMPLEKSFRVHPAGAAFVNHFFAELLPAYEPILSARRESPPGESVEILLADPGEEGDAEAATLAQAEVVAERIERMVEDGERRVWDRSAGSGQSATAGGWRAVRPGDVAILFSRMTHSLAYEHALRERGLPYYVLAGSGFFQQQEVYDVLNAVKAIDNPHDDVALVGTLRGRAFGLSDNGLLALARAGGPPYVDRLGDAAALDALTGADRRAARSAADLLGRLHAVKDALGPAGVIDRFLTETNLPAILLSEFHGNRKLGNVRRLQEAARQAQAGGLSLADFARRIEQLTVEEARYEQAPVAGESDDVVRLMTIHKAKGLEFPVVILPDLNAGPRAQADPLIFRADLGVVYKPAVAPADGEDGEDGPGEEPPAAHELARRAEADELRAEDRRKLYVAVTRAEDYLILVGADLRNSDGGLKEKDSPLVLLDGVLDIAGAIERAEERIGYGDGYAARVARVEPSPARRRRGPQPVGRRLVAQAEDADGLAASLAAAGSDEARLPLVGPLPAEVSAGERIAPTILADFGRCPMLYRWRHELRVPQAYVPQAFQPQSPVAQAFEPVEISEKGGKPVPHGIEQAGKPILQGFDAATAGTFYHLCMERLDFAALADPAADVGAVAADLATRAAAEMDLPPGADPPIDELVDMLGRLRGGDFLAGVAAAEVRLAELRFTFQAGTFEIGGQIDLLYRDRSGDWHVVDYKSDRVPPGRAAGHARGYRLQMLLYLAAARRQWGDAVRDATLWFLRTGESVAIPAEDAATADLPARLAELSARLTEARRSGRFEPVAGEHCDFCPYRGLCR
jgi:ATP-dependent helicase/nuclease subunit A